MRAYKRRYSRSAAGKVAHARYRSSTKGAIYMRAYNEAHREETRLRARQWYHANKLRAWLDNRLTPDEFDQMLCEQAGRCAICSDPMTKPYVDHDHGTGEIRGLLCIGCNSGIGLLRESPAILRRAIEYLGVQ